MHVRSLDMLFAYKALSVEPNLTAIDRRVGAALLEHLNRRSGRCDPGLERIAGLLAVNTRTVMRALKRLEAAGLFKRIRHGGLMNRNRYVPNWTRFREIEAAWSTSCKTPKVSPAPRQESHFPGDSRVAQTSYINQSKGTSYGLPKDRRGDRPLSQQPSGEGVATAVAPGSTGSITTPTTRAIGPPRSICSAVAAREAALRRWTDALNRRFGHQPLTYQDILEAIDQSMIEAATNAELARRGGGITYIVAQLRLGSLGTQVVASTCPHASANQDRGEA